MTPLPQEEDIVRQMVEVVVIWALYPQLENGVGLPIERRLSQQNLAGLYPFDIDLCIAYVYIPVSDTMLKSASRSPESLYRIAQGLFDIAQCDELRENVLASCASDLTAALIQLTHSSLLPDHRTRSEQMLSKLVQRFVINTCAFCARIYNIFNSFC
jgi:hypothetical protein